ncbi:MAG: sigma-70 family RNA polymerase sigma factor [Clostridia bacterium]|nr:sigma-70 family RNA polymerase sigma factor [Clostridia bacterium]
MQANKQEEIVGLLFDRDETVLAQISVQYSGLYKKILKQILSNDEDICECENDVLLAVWNSIPPNRPNNFAAYVCKLARNISINRFKYNNRAKRSSGYTLVVEELCECIPDNSTEKEYNKVEREEINEIISNFVRELDAETRVLFVRRYFYLESVTSLAERFEIPENRISVKLFRARNKLQDVFRKEGIAL